MSDSPRRHRTPTWLTATGVVLVLLAVYVGGYFVLGEYRFDETYLMFLANPDNNPDLLKPYHERGFPHATLPIAYYPMAWIECRVRGGRVTLLSRYDDLDIFADKFIVSDAVSFDPP